MNVAPPLTLPTSAILAACLAVSCGGSDAKLEAARHNLQRGRLDQVLAILEDATGPEAEAIRSEVARREASRIEALSLLERFRTARGDRELADLVSELRGMLEGVEDSTIREWIQQEISTTSDWVAERNATRPRSRSPRMEERSVDEEFEEPLDPAREENSPSLLGSILESVEADRSSGQWQDGLERIDRLIADAPEIGPLLESRRQELVEGAERDAEVLLDRAERLLAQEGDEPTWRLLNRSIGRFPRDADTGSAVERLVRLEDRLRSTLVGAPTAREDIFVAEAPDPGSRPPDVTVPVQEQDPEQETRQEPVEVPGPQKIAPDADVEPRSAEAPRGAVGSGVPGPPPAPGSPGAVGPMELPAAEALVVARLALEREFTDTDLSSLEPGAIEKLVANSSLAAPVRLGLIVEHLRNRQAATATGHEKSLQELERMSSTGELELEVAWEVLAWYRGEPVPEEGYTFVRGRWQSPLELAEASLARRLEREVARMGGADGEALLRIGTRLAEVVSGAPDPRRAQELLSGLVEKEGETAIRRMQASPTWRRLQELVLARADLERLRAVAISRITDEETYFYPYSPPDHPDRTYAQYVVARDEVRAAVDDVREIWEANPSVKLPSDFRATATRLEFLLGLPASWRGSLSIPEDWADRYEGLDLTGEEVDLQGMARSATEGAGLRRDRAVSALNSDRQGGAGAGLPDVEEQRVLELTNAYRTMLGRRALAWDPRLYEACGWHSAYMAETGNFTHTEEGVPGRRSPRDRMSSAGYPDGWNENCQQGSEWARQAFESWCGSSAHHRTLISDEPTEAAAARVGTYWTMKFGRGNDFENDLDPWRD